MKLSIARTAVFLLPSLLSASKILSPAALDLNAAQPSGKPSLDWTSSIGVSWAPRNATLYAIITQNNSNRAAGFSQDALLDGAPSMLGGYGALVFGGAGNTAFVLNSGSDGSGLGLALTSPGALLAEWNTIPMVQIRDRGNPAVDDYPRDFAPGSLVFGSIDPDAFHFVPPDVILAGGARSAPPVLTPSGLSSIGVNPQQFAGAPLTDNAFRTAAPAPPPVQIDATTTAVPTVIFSPEAPPASKTVPAVASSAIVTPPAAVADPAVVTSSTAPPTIATVALVAMTTPVNSADAQALTMPQLTGGRMSFSALTTSIPEPGSASGLGLGLAVLAWRLRRSLQRRKSLSF